MLHNSIANWLKCETKPLLTRQRDILALHDEAVHALASGILLQRVIGQHIERLMAGDGALGDLVRLPPVAAVLAAHAAQRGVAALCLQCRRRFIARYGVSADDA